MKKKEREEKLDELEGKFSEGKQYGLDIQKEDIKIVNACDIGKEYIDFIRKEKTTSNKPEINAWIVDANPTIPTHPPQNLQQIGNYAMAVSTSRRKCTFCWAICRLHR